MSQSADLIHNFSHISDRSPCDRAASNGPHIIDTDRTGSSTTSVLEFNRPVDRVMVSPYNTARGRQVRRETLKSVCSENLVKTRSWDIVEPRF